MLLTLDQALADIAEHKRAGWALTYLHVPAVNLLAWRAEKGRKRVLWAFISELDLWRKTAD